MKPSDVLTRVLTLWERGQWIQGDFAKRAPTMTSSGRRTEKNTAPPPRICYCLDGAIKRFTNRSANTSLGRETREFVQEALNVSLADEIWDWNDQKNRTLAQIISATKRARKLALAAGQ